MPVASSAASWNTCRINETSAIQRVRQFYLGANKCIGDDTKAAASKAQIALKTKKNMAKTIFKYSGCNSCTLQCGTIMALISPGDCTLQCGRWLWDDMRWKSPKRPPYLNSTSGFDFDHITAVDMSFCTSLRNFIQIVPTSVEKKVMSIFKMADFSHLGF